MVELVVAILVLSIITISILQLFTALVNSALLMKRKSVALTLATNQMEYLKSLPYNNLAVAGGSIVATNPLPASFVKKVNGTNFTVRTSINYIDDAYDGCGSYPNQTLKERYCRNYPSPSGAPTTDTNAGDYKIINVSVTDPSGRVLSDVDTQIAARVAETASNTGAVFVYVIDQSGNPVTGANVRIRNTSVSPGVDVNDDTDAFGVTIFYGLPPDTSNYDYAVTASLTGYSTLSTIAPNGTLVPTYSNAQLISQQSSYVTLTIKPMSQYSMVAEAVDLTGNPISNLKLYIKGGYKRYTNTSDTSYYYDNMTPTDIRPTTDAGGLAGFNDLVPGAYIFCGDAGATNCRIGTTTYYLVAAVPYSGTNALKPIMVPSNTPSTPPTTTFDYEGAAFLQKVRLIFSTASNTPRINSLIPDEASLSTADLANFNFQITGVNLPCSTSPASCGTTVRLLQESSIYTASCTGTSAGTTVSCTVNLTGVVLGNTQLQVTSNGQTVTMPGAPMIGGVVVVP